MRVNLQHKTNILKYIRMKNLFTIIAASLLLGTASMAAADPDFVIVSAEHTGIDNNPAYLDLRPNDTTLRTTAASRIVVCNVMGQMVPTQRQPRFQPQVGSQDSTLPVKVMR